MRLVRLSAALFLFLLTTVGLVHGTYLHSSGTQLKDAAGNTVLLTGVNWFGFETSNLSPHGLWARDWKGVLMQIKEMGFNCVRIPVIGFEPHGKTSSGGARWGSGDPAYDWNTAAQKCGNAILAVNPDVLIIVEGVEQVGSTMYWWGGNMRGVKTHPIQLSKPDKLVYSPHEYGPEVFQQEWFSSPSFPGNMTSIWEEAFGFIRNQGVAPLLIGEFGIKDTSSYNGKALVWFKKFLEYMGTTISWTIWCFNPNSGDTGGMLQYDWVTPVQWKLDLIKPYLAPPVGTQVSNRANTHLRPVQRTSSSSRLVAINGRNVPHSAGIHTSASTLAHGLYLRVGNDGKINSVVVGRN